ncbi:MAG: hypothetical protein P8Y58_03845 [Novosphingobium sp.]
MLLPVKPLAEAVPLASQKYIGPKLKCGKPQADDKTCKGAYCPVSMESLRAFFLRHRGLACVLVVAALFLKAAVPTGFMIGADSSRTITITICHDASGDRPAQQIAIPMKKGEGEAPGKPAKGECPYAALSMASLSGADVALLALALAFIIALGFAPVRFTLPPRPSFLLPPLRGPPALI